MSSLNQTFEHKVAIIMGSDSDLRVMKPAVDTLEEFDIKTEVCILSAHRTPLEMMEYAKKAESNNIKIIIAGAGGAAHLPGMVASLTSIPVIGVPVMGKTLKGIDSLLSIVQMPNGVPVATVAINGAQNAGLLALRILSVGNKDIKNKLDSYQKTLHNLVRNKNKKLMAIGVDNYLSNC